VKNPVAMVAAVFRPDLAAALLSLLRRHMAWNVRLPAFPPLGDPGRFRCGLSSVDRSYASSRR